MKKYFYVFIVIVGLGIMGCGHWPWDRGDIEKLGENVIVNPGFEDSLNDWIIEIDTTGAGEVSSIVGEVNLAIGSSSPNCCSIYTKARVASDGGWRWCKAEVMVSQYFSKIPAESKVKADIKHHFFAPTQYPSFMLGCSLQVYVDSLEWKTIWHRIVSPDEYDTTSTWGKIEITVDKTINGIRFCVTSTSNGVSGSHTGSWSTLWIDDVYVGEIIKEAR